MTVRKGVVGGVAALAAVAALGVWAGRTWVSDLPLPRTPSCTVRAGGQVTLDVTQMANAATITAIGVRDGMPERAVVIALATAYQESRLENLRHGDRDSLGLFQQRPSKGWGTPEQINDPRYSAATFYAALKKVKGWEKMRVTDAAQRVQRSAYPEAYERWADQSVVLAEALLGKATGAVACELGNTPKVRGGAAARAVAEALRLDWGDLPAVAQPDALGLSVGAPDARAGWQYAHWLVAHAEDHGVRRVRFGTLQWTAGKGVWNTAKDSEAAGDGSVLAEVYADA
uniref:hypothetical protein n=1 Tax=Rhizomonospora bruguierae TaxID=1581705 RepID=UPI001BCB1A2D